MNGETSLRRVFDAALTKDQFEWRYPDGGYWITGEIAFRGSRKDPTSRRSIKDDRGRKHKVLGPGVLGKKWKTIGYLHHGQKDNEWIVIKASRVPSIFAACLSLAILLSLIGVVTVLLNLSPDIDPLARKYSNPTLDRPAGEKADSIAIPGYGTWDLALGRTDLRVALANAEGNPCYMKYTVILDETGEVLYQSKLIPPGEAVTEFQISRTLTAGTHPITIKMDNYDLNDYNLPLNNAEVSSRIYVG